MSVTNGNSVYNTIDLSEYATKQNVEEIFYANQEIPASTLRFSFGDPNYDPTQDTAVASRHNTADRAGGGTPAGYGGTWKKLLTKFANIWDYTYVDNTLLSEFDNGGFTYANRDATRFWNDVKKNPIKIIASNTSGCTNFKRAFQGIWALTEVWELDTSDSTNSQIMFQYCKNLRRVPKILDFSSITSGTTVVAVFAWCSSLEEINQIILPDDDTLSLDMQIFAKGCASLKSVNEPINCKSITNINNSFAGCVSLSHLELENTNRITNFASSFSSCKSLPFEFFDTLDTSAGTDLNYICDGYSAQESSGVMIWEIYEKMNNITTVPAFDFSSATETFEAFGFCNIQEIDATKLASLSGSVDVRKMFRENRNCKSGILNAYAVLDTVDSKHTDCFRNCGIDTEEGRAELEQIPVSWGGLLEE